MAKRNNLAMIGLIGFIGGFSTHGLLRVLREPKKPTSATWYITDSRYSAGDCFVSYDTVAKHLGTVYKVVSESKDFYLITDIDFVTKGRAPRWAIKHIDKQSTDDSTYRVGCDSDS